MRLDKNDEIVFPQNIKIESASEGGYFVKVKWNNKDKETIIFQDEAELTNYLNDAFAPVEDIDLEDYHLSREPKESKGTEK